MRNLSKFLIFKGDGAPFINNKINNNINGNNNQKYDQAKINNITEIIIKI